MTVESVVGYYCQDRKKHTAYLLSAFEDKIDMKAKKFAPKIFAVQLS